MKRTYKEPEIEILEYEIKHMVGTDLVSGDVQYGEGGFDGPEY